MWPPPRPESQAPRDYSVHWELALPWSVGVARYLPRPFPCTDSRESRALRQRAQRKGYVQAVVGTGSYSETWGHVLGLLFASCVTLGQVLNLSEPSLLQPFCEMYLPYKPIARSR